MNDEREGRQGRQGSQASPAVGVALPVSTADEIKKRARKVGSYYEWSEERHNKTEAARLWSSN